MEADAKKRNVPMPMPMPILMPIPMPMRPYPALLPFLSLTFLKALRFQFSLLFTCVVSNHNLFALICFHIER